MANCEPKKDIFRKELTRRELFRFVLESIPEVLPAGGALYLLMRSLKQPKVPTSAHASSNYQVYLPVITKNYSEAQIMGICYSPYRDSQDPDWGPYPSEGDIKADIDILTPVTGYIRTYGADHNLENIPRYILDKGSSIKVNAGCWLGNNTQVNNNLIANLINEANSTPNVISVNVGNETQQFGTLLESQLISYINQVRQNISRNTTVTTGETWYPWTQHPQLVESVDYIFAHFFPYWEPNPIPIDGAVSFVRDKYHLLQSLYPGKKVVIGETGWPSTGQIRGGAIPSIDNQRRFINEFLTWARSEKVDFYLFEGFDENWKIKYEGEVGRHWGIYNSNRTLKHPGFSLR